MSGDRMLIIAQFLCVCGGGGGYVWCLDVCYDEYRACLVVGC